MTTPKRTDPRADRNLFNYVNKGPDRTPNFARTLAALPNAELLDERELGKGGPDFQAAVTAEIERRGL